MSRPIPSPGAARRAVAAAEEILSRIAHRSLDSAYARMLDDSAIVLEGGEAIALGKTAGLTRLHASGTSVGSWTPVRIDASADAKEAYSFGYMTVRDTSGGAARSVELGGKYIAYWRLRGEDEWRVIVLVRSFQRHVTPEPAPPGFGAPSVDARSWSQSARDPRVSLVEADRRFDAYAASHSVPDAFAAFAAPDGASLSSGERIAFGADSIRASLPPASAMTLSWNPCFAHVVMSGDLGFTIGTATRHAVPSGAVGFSKYLTIWRRSSAGEWRYEVDGGNSSPPHQQCDVPDGWLVPEGVVWRLAPNGRRPD